MSNPNRFYTYAYLREDRTPYYIGKGKGNRAYKKYGRIFSPPPKNRIIKLKQNLTEEEAFKHEKYMIAVFGRKDNGTGILRNLTDGGEGNSGTIFSQKRREKIRKSKLGKSSPFKGKTYEEISGKNFLERIEKLRKSNTGKVRSEETKKKISNSKKGARAWNKGISTNWKYIYKLISPNGDIVTTKSMNDLCKKNELSVTCMFRLVSGKQKQHKGWILLERKHI